MDLPARSGLNRLTVAPPGGDVFAGDAHSRSVDAGGPGRCRFAGGAVATRACCDPTPGDAATRRETDDPGYVEQPSPVAGGRLTPAGRHRRTLVPGRVYRCGAAMELVQTTGWLQGRNVPAHLPWHDWGRPTPACTAKRSLPGRVPPVRRPRVAPGVYVAVLVEGDANGRDRTDPDRSTPDGREAARVGVRPPAPWSRSSTSCPSCPTTPTTWRAASRTTRSGRPGSGRLQRAAGARGPDLLPVRAGCTARAAARAAPPTTCSTHPFDYTPRQTYVHWDAKFVAWMERKGDEADYCTDVDLHRVGRDLLDPYGARERRPRRDGSDAMRGPSRGTSSTAVTWRFFSGNTCRRRGVFDDHVTFERLHFWHEPDQPGEPENRMVGVSFRNGGERDRDDHPVPVGYRVRTPATGPTPVRECRTATCSASPTT